MPILIAEDDLRLAKNLVYLLKKDGYQVDHAKDGEEALLYCESNAYDVVILDWMMPVMSGIDVCRHLRKQHFQNGILLLTAKDTLDDKVRGLDAGADDYLIKPFEFSELSARIRALLRRSSKDIYIETIQVGPFQIDRQNFRIFYDGIDLELTRKEYELLDLLLENNGQILPKDTLINRVWGLDQDNGSNNLEAYIRLLRRKLSVYNHKKIIKNIRGIGYKTEA